MQLTLYDDGTVTPAWKKIAPVAADYRGPGIPSGNGSKRLGRRHQNASRLACERAGGLCRIVSRKCPCTFRGRVSKGN
jgi:hypothetical protein